MRSVIRRATAAGVLLVAALTLTGCATSQGPVLRGGTPTLACAQIIDYSVPLVTADLNNTTSQPLTVTEVTPLRASNMQVVDVRVGPVDLNLTDINKSSTAFYLKQFKPVGESMSVTVPAHSLYQIVALVSIPDHTTVGSIAAFAVDYKIGWRTYRGTTTVGYKMSSRANACATTNQ